jgi:predicted phage terminase large subunit-like protein
LETQPSPEAAPEAKIVRRLTKESLSKMTDEDRLRLKTALTIRRQGVSNDYVSKAKPNSKQSQFLASDVQELLYGGAAGGGKSIALWMAALQYVHVPGYHALILRRTFRDLSLPKALMDVSHRWLSGTPAKWRAVDHTWVFPSGATITFGYLEAENDKFRYQSAEFQFVGFDELTQFSETQYTFLFSRLRRTSETSETFASTSRIPLRMRAASNPGGAGHEWVRNRFIPEEYSRASIEERYGRVWQKIGYDAEGNPYHSYFIPARLEDNPNLDQDAYDRSLSHLGPVVRAQMRRGDWDVFEKGNLFLEDWFSFWTSRGDSYVIHRNNQKNDNLPIHRCEFFLTADTASTQKADSAYTTICVWALDSEKMDLLLVHVHRQRMEVPDIAPKIFGLGQSYRVTHAIVENKENGIGVIQQLRRPPFSSLSVRDYDPGSRDKVSRSTTAQIRMQAGQIMIPQEAQWLAAWKAEILQFPDGQFADQVDCLSMAAQYVSDRGGVTVMRQPEKMQGPPLRGFSFGQETSGPFGIHSR